MIRKNEEYIVNIIDNGFQGEGIAKIDGITVFIPNAIKDEKIRIKILKVNSSIAYGKIIEVLKKSESRVDADCKTYYRCGGCAMRHINYDETVKIKQKSVETTLTKALGRKINVSNAIKMENPYNYRNKLQYPIGMDELGNPVMGVYAERTHKIIPTTECKIQDKLSQEIANSIYEFILENKIQVYNEVKLTGSIRHLIIRIGKRTNEVMITIVTNTKEIFKEKELVSFIKFLICFAWKSYNHICC